MGLYLAVFDGDEEVEGVEVGSYGDFAFVRDPVLRHVEQGRRGSRCPVLMMHSDCDGEWTVAEAAALRNELRLIRESFERLPPVYPPARWARHAMGAKGVVPRTLADAFVDVDGESLFVRLDTLCETALRVQQPIVFQ